MSPNGSDFIGDIGVKWLRPQMVHKSWAITTSKEVGLLCLINLGSNSQTNPFRQFHVVSINLGTPCLFFCFLQGSE